MRFSRARSITIVSGLVLSGCGTVLPAPDETLPERNTDPTEPAPSAASPAETVAAPATDPMAGTAVAVDAGSDASAKKANGEDCTSGAECQSGECFPVGKTHYCTIKCPKPEEEEEPLCQALGPAFNGACSKEGFCKR